MKRCFSLSDIFGNNSKNIENCGKYFIENCSEYPDTQFSLNLFIKCWLVIKREQDLIKTFKK